MYTNLFQYFGLRENAFHVSPDPRFFFSTGVHASALAELSAGVDSHQGLIVLIGEAGTGKTILLHKFLNWLRARRQSSSYIFQSQLKPL
ncbi:MAG: AAA family ATPase, partial [Candidatus Acidiferrum sp.]